MPKITPPRPVAANGAEALAAHDERAHRTLLKMVRLAHAMSEEEREIALMLMQAVTAWSATDQAA